VGRFAHPRLEARQLSQIPPRAIRPPDDDVGEEDGDEPRQAKRVHDYPSRLLTRSMMTAAACLNARMRKRWRPHRVMRKRILTSH
jgi:hypothetical protein